MAAAVHPVAGLLLLDDFRPALVAGHGHRRAPARAVRERSERREGVAGGGTPPPP